MKIVKESISFERKKDPKITLLGWMPGDILINPHTFICGILLDKNKHNRFSNTNDNYELIFTIGHLNTQNRITNRNPRGKNFFKISENMEQKLSDVEYSIFLVEKWKLRFTTQEEKEIIKQGLFSYIDEIEEKLKIKVLI